jgi:alkylation response protein AidB-like acyl-CoA dehydrogenase
MVDFSITDEQLALAEAVGTLMGDRPDFEAVDASDELWRKLAKFGAFAMLTKGGGGDLPDVVALLGALGAALCPGPVVASVAAGALDMPEEELARLSEGRQRITVVVDGYVPWAGSADTVLSIDGNEVWRVDVDIDDSKPTATLSGEPWAVARTRPTEALPNGSRFVTATELGLAAAMLGMARTLLGRAAEHARTRVQFGQPIGSFQGVAHPLAEAWARVTAADDLVRLVAFEACIAGPSSDRARLARSQASVAALHTAYVSHQAMGAMSFAEQSGIGTITTRMRQWSCLLPTPPF